MTLKPISYTIASHEFEDAWNAGQQANEQCERALSDMIQALELQSLTRTAVMKKIVEDHKHLQGFSRRNLYRHIPEDKKRVYFTKSAPKAKELEQVPSGTYAANEHKTEREPANITTNEIEAVEEPRQVLPEWIRIELTKFVSRSGLLAWYDNGGIVYVRQVDGDVKEMESATQHMMKARAVEARH